MVYGQDDMVKNDEPHRADRQQQKCHQKAPSKEAFIAFIAFIRFTASKRNKTSAVRVPHLSNPLRMIKVIPRKEDKEHPTTKGGHGEAGCRYLNLNGERGGNDKYESKYRCNGYLRKRFISIITITNISNKLSSLSSQLQINRRTHLKQYYYYQTKEEAPKEEAPKEETPKEEANGEAPEEKETSSNVIGVNKKK